MSREHLKYLKGADEMSFGGLKVIASPFVMPVPVLQLSHDFNAVSPEFKAKFNQWLLEYFGTKEVALVMPDMGCAFVSPKHYAMIKGLQL